ncbi:hypothetical protein ACOI1H_05440 [Loktanella sp. DJP18]|uniref:hypothetical protein n=1 Tax=Loktanella sp. DJP18 TaxID=3409788 RepID=UPI003BB62939
MIRAASAALILLAGQAQALSCLAPDPLASFTNASASDMPYLVLTGDLATPSATGVTEPQPTTRTAQLTGFELTADGFTVPFDGEVLLDVTCAGPWCGALPASGPIVAFARIDGPVPVIEMSACGGWLFADPDQATLDHLTECMNGKTCSAQPLQ